jgi:hypothetical protein
MEDCLMLNHPVYEFLKDIDELKWFWTYAMRPLKQHEVYFISLSARNKRLSAEEEREYFHLGRSEMFHKEIITEDEFSRFLRGIRRCESNKLAYLTKSGRPYPDKVLVLYANIAPTDAYSAMTKQLENLMSIQRALTDSVLRNSPSGIALAYQNIRHSHTTGQSVFARSFSDSDWTDIDSDIEFCETDDNGRDAFRKVKDFLYGEIGRGNFMQIQTAGGFHWLIRKSILSDVGRKYKADPVTSIIAFIHSIFKAHGVTVNEIVKNRNGMIPLPGTVQYGSHIVRVMNKQDFIPTMQMHTWPEYLECPEGED